MKWIKLMKSKKQQQDIFNQMFRPYTNKEVKKNTKWLKQKKHAKKR